VKIRTKINVLVVVAAILFPCAFGAVLVFEKQMKRDLQHMVKIERLIDDANQLRVLVMESVLYREDRASAQWFLQIASTTLAIDKMDFGSLEENASVARIRKQIVLANTVFSRLRQAQQSVMRDSPGLPMPEMHAETAAQTVSSLIVITQEMVDTGRELLNFNHEEMARSLFLMQLSIVILILSMLLLLGYVWNLVSRGVLRPLRLIELGTQRIAIGDYDTRLSFLQNDEIGMLGSEFDRMTERVRHAQLLQAAEVENSRRAERALQESSEYIQAILDNVVDGIITIDQFGMVQSANRAVETIFQYEPSELIGKNVSILMPEPYRSEHDGYLNNYRQSGKARVIGIGRQVKGQRKNGKIFPMDLAVSLTMHSGKPLFIGLVRDISERHRIEVMKTEFVSTVSHELRTPLTSISGALGLVTGGVLGEIPPKMQSILGIAHKNSLQLTHLINDLLDMEKMLAGKMQFDFLVQPLMPVIVQSVEANRAYGEKYGVSFAIGARVDELMVNIDEARLQQVLANFLSNAAKFSPAASVVTVNVSVLESKLRVAVQDHGPGIPDEFRSRIFQKFSQADSSDTRQKGGTGLGLAVCKELIARMHGEIGFESVPGQGANFYFELPIVAAVTPLHP
jgi:PAS domain S-box-containing protein